MANKARRKKKQANGQREMLAKIRELEQKEGGTLLYYPDGSRRVLVAHKGWVA